MIKPASIAKRVTILPKSFFLRLKRALQLRKALSTCDALRIVCRSTRNRSELRVKIRDTDQEITLRPNTSDLSCLEKVFVDEEYRLPYQGSAFDINPRLIVDAGANIGTASLYFANTFPEASIIAIEPDVANFELLKRNCAPFQNITTVNAAVWPVETKLEIANPSADNWAFTVQPVSEIELGVDAITIPQVIAMSGEQSIDVLKIDIEGAEKELFGDSCQGWLSSVSIIVIELHDRFRHGCSEAFYSNITTRHFTQEVRGENIFVWLPNLPT